jgi:hypothetical protein
MLTIESQMAVDGITGREITLVRSSVNLDVAMVSTAQHHRLPESMWDRLLVVVLGAVALLGVALVVVLVPMATFAGLARSRGLL